MSRLYSIVGAVGLALASAAQPCFAIACGDTITGSATLDADLTCGTDPALTVAAGASLDMNGFGVICSAGNGGIHLEGGTKLANGYVTSCNGAVFMNNGDNQITNVYVNNAPSGFIGEEAGDTLIDCAAYNTGAYALNLPAGGNVTGFLASTNGDGVVSFNSTDNKFSDIVVSDSLYYGVFIDGDNVKVSKVVTANNEVGIIIGGAKASSLRAIDSTDYGVSVSGGPTKVSKVTVTNGGASAHGIELGSGISLSKAQVQGGDEGIRMPGYNGSISKSFASGHTHAGIIITGSENEISKNLSLYSNEGFDDGTECSGTNIWSNNVGSKADACIE